MFQLSLGRSLCELQRSVTAAYVALGASGLISGLTLPRILELQASAASPIAAKAKSCIFLFLEGGSATPGYVDPETGRTTGDSRAFRNRISTNVPDIFVTDQLPLCAQMADKYTIVRSHSHSDNGHSTGYHYVMTGRRPTFADGDNPIPNNDFPSIGSAVARTRVSRGSVPPYINLPHPMSAGGPGFTARNMCRL